jgi:hypothetical protein
MHGGGVDGAVALRDVRFVADVPVVETDASDLVPKGETGTIRAEEHDRLRAMLGNQAPKGGHSLMGDGLEKRKPRPGTHPHRWLTYR